MEIIDNELGENNLYRDFIVKSFYKEVVELKEE